MLGHEICEICSNESATTEQLEQVNERIANVTNILNDFLPNAISNDLTENQKLDLKYKMGQVVQTTLLEMKWFPDLSKPLQQNVINFALARYTQLTVLNGFQPFKDGLASIEDKIELVHFISYYGADVKELNHLWTAFNDMKKDSEGNIIQDSYSENFIERATKKTGHHIDAVFEMLTTGNSFKDDSLWSLVDDCNVIFPNFKALLLRSFHLRTIGLELKGEKMTASEQVRFQNNMSKLTKYYELCLAQKWKVEIWKMDMLL